MVATASLGMGVNVADVGRVVLWKFPITKSLEDLWQRLVAVDGATVGPAKVTYFCRIGPLTRKVLIDQKLNSHSHNQTHLRRPLVDHIGIDYQLIEQ